MFVIDEDNGPISIQPQSDCHETLPWLISYSLDLSCAFYHNAHPISLDDSHGGFPGDEFAFGDDIDDVIGETCFAAGSQYGDGCAMHSGRKRQCGCEVSRRAGQRWSGRT